MQPDSTPSPLASVHTHSLPLLLEQYGISLLITTYQAGKVVFVRADQGVANTHFRNFTSPMGTAVHGQRLVIGTRHHVWEFRNQPDVAVKLEPTGRFDACYLPRSCHVTGDIGVHEIAFAGDEPWIVNTRFSCLCTLALDYSFVPRWRPPFVRGYAPDDRCHLNGLGVRDGQPRYVTALGETDAPAGWRPNKAFGGCLVDVATNQVLLGGLSMPHSPRWYADRLWLLESGRGSLANVDLRSGSLKTVASMPGFTRGLDFHGPLAFVGLSQVRETAVFSGLPITEQARERFCGVWVVNLETGAVVGFLRFLDSVQEVFAVQVLVGTRYPELFNQDEDQIGNSYVLPDEALREVS